MGDDVRDLLGKLAEVDRRAAVWCTCQCVRTVLHFLPVEEERPKRVIERLEAWVRGQVTQQDCLEAFDTAVNVLDDYCGSSVEATEVVVVAVADALARVAEAVVSRPVFCGLLCAAAVRHAANAVATAADSTEAWRGWFALDTAEFTESEGTDAWHVAQHAHLAVLHLVVCAQRWPLTVPSFEALHTTPTEAVAVAWGLVAADPRTEQTVLELASAYQRAQRVDLDWDDPMQRAIAERTTDEDRLRALLGRHADDDG